MLDNLKIEKYWKHPPSVHRDFRPESGSRAMYTCLPQLTTHWPMPLPNPTEC